MHIKHLSPEDLFIKTVSKFRTVLLLRLLTVFMNQSLQSTIHTLFICKDFSWYALLDQNLDY
jgi:hypothetical protein